MRFLENETILDGHGNYSIVKCKPYGKTFPVKHEPGGRKFHIAIPTQYLSAIGLTRRRGIAPAAQVFVGG